MTSPPGLSVFFPAYNDAGTIASLVMTALMTAETLTPDFEVIVINDGSADRTAEILDELARVYPRLRVVHHVRNRGYGGALRSGFATASKDWVFYTDGDGQYDPAEMTRAVGAQGRRRRPGQRLQDQPLRSVPPHRHRPRLPPHRQAAVRAAGARRRLRLPAAAADDVRAHPSREEQRRHLPGDDEEDHRRGLPHRGSAGAPLPPHPRHVAVLQLPPHRPHRHRRAEAVVGAGDPPRPSARPGAGRRRRARRAPPASGRPGSGSPRP